MATNNMHNLTTLIKRLEAATSRLEDMVGSTIDTSPQPNGVKSISEITPGATPTPSIPPAPPAAAAAPPVPKAPVEELPESVEGFDELLSSTIKKYVDASNELGGPVKAQAQHVLKVFEAERKLILISTKAKKPDMAGADFMELLKPLQAEIGKVVELKDANRGHASSNQLSAVAESIGVVAWVTIDTKPFKHVEESLGSAQYFGNRVLKEFKDKDEKQVAWIKSFYQIFKDLAEYVKNTFPFGLPWNPKGVSLKEAIKAADSPAASAPPAAPAPPAGGAPPPPPPPGPPPKFEIQTEEAPKPAAGSINAVFSELNKGEAITKSLKKVSASEMTHKNPSLRAGATVPTRSDSQSSASSISRAKSPAPRKTPKPEALRTKKPARKALEGNKWIIENFENETEPIEIEASIQHSILISRCAKTTIRVLGKANAISIDNSPRLSLVIDSLVSSVDVIKSPNFAMQVLGTLPTILLDQVDGAQVYLSKESMGTEVFSSKCSSINLNVIEGEEGDYKECALPEQIRTWIDGEGKIRSEIVEHAG